jgi:hypothetical protein
MVSPWALASAQRMKPNGAKAAKKFDSKPTKAVDIALMA